MLYPLLLDAPLKDYIWGGQRLKKDFNKATDLEKVSESWELSCHKDGMSIIKNGSYRGRTLAEYIADEGNDVLGENGKKFSYFPILIKLIDAADNLSVQVHPDNDYALKVEGEYGKTEMWYVVDCEDGAELLYGFKHKISAEEFEKRINENTLLEVCNNVPVKKGDVFFIEAGTLHAIGKGMLIAEIQQNSNTTYRIYDYGRKGKDGKTRELHVDKAKQVTRLEKPTRKTGAVASIDFLADVKMQLLAECEYFTAYKLNIDKKASLTAGKASFQALLVLDGIIELKAENAFVTAKKGETIFIPAGMGDYSLHGKAEIILSMV
jgi:mannose-6-phosphate isomerase